MSFIGGSKCIERRGGSTYGALEFVLCSEVISYFRGSFPLYIIVVFCHFLCGHIHYRY